MKAADGRWAVVDLDGLERRASLALVPQAAEGDWVLIAAGHVLEVLRYDEVLELRRLLDRVEAPQEGASS